MCIRDSGMGSAENDEKYDLGHAGGYVGYAEGAQIWGDTESATGCNVGNLRLVKGTNTVGGYAGTAAPGSAADANTHASNGLLQGLSLIHIYRSNRWSPLMIRPSPLQRLIRL